MTHCRLESHWVTRTRVGLPNHAMARLAFANLELVGGPQWDDEARSFCRELQKNLGIEPMDEPILVEMTDLCSPEEGEAQLRAILPPWQLNYTSDDYVDWTWHTPTVRLIVGRCTLKAPEGYTYPDWSWNALGGHAPTIMCAAKVIGATVVDLLTDPRRLQEARAEFEERTGGGIGGSSWVARRCCRATSSRRSASPGRSMSRRRAAMAGTYRKLPEVSRCAATRRGRP